MGLVYHCYTMLLWAEGVLENDTQIHNGHLHKLLEMLFLEEMKVGNVADVSGKDFLNILWLFLPVQFQIHHL